MKLKSLLENLQVSGSFNEDAEVLDVVSDSRSVKSGSLFVCIRGLRFDGHSAAQQALEKGAAAVVVDHSLGLEGEVIVDNTRNALAVLCSNYFGRPQEKLKLIAVTGTNGKTTIANVIKQSLEHCGKKAGLIGTIGIEIGDLTLPAKFTTPEPWDLEMIFSTMVNAGCEYAVMEASSQALEQGRLYDLHFDTAIFTNLSQDHLDYHKTMEAYFEAKCMLFEMCDYAVINTDDSAGKTLFARTSCEKVSYALEDPDADYRAHDLSLKIDGSSFQVCSGNCSAYCNVPLPGRFSVYNALSCIATVHRAVGDLQKSCEAVSNTRGVSGRCEILHRWPKTVICDYAHTDDALLKLLSSVKPYVGDGKLIVLFGCAGRRDKTKRIKMAKVVAEYADVAVLSSDNPRDEDPFEIMHALEPVFLGNRVPYLLIPDRYFAVSHVVGEMKDDDVFVLCGKGHEDYQVEDGYTMYLDERRIVRDYFDKEQRE